MKELEWWWEWSVVCTRMSFAFTGALVPASQGIDALRKTDAAGVDHVALALEIEFDLEDSPASPTHC